MGSREGAPTIHFDSTYRAPGMRKVSGGCPVIARGCPLVPVGGDHWTTHRVRLRGQVQVIAICGNLSFFESEQTGDDKIPSFEMANK